MKNTISQVVCILEECLLNGNRGGDMIIYWFYKDKEYIEKAIAELKEIEKQLKDQNEQ